LSIDTDDEEASIYLDSRYIGKSKVFIEYLVPGAYLITLTKENFLDRNESITLINGEEKELILQIREQKELQVVDFYIEPLGTKIYINSVFQGRSPFKKALAKGNYVISTKNDLYENYRYILSINEIKKDETSVVFHLKSKDINTYFKLKRNLYYASFWCFTFSMIATIPLTVFAFEYFYKAGEYVYKYGEDDWKAQQLEKTKNIFYGFAAGFVANTVLSLAWLIFSAVDYLRTLEKRDFFPIIEYYKSIEGREEVKIGMKVKI